MNVEDNFPTNRAEAKAYIEHEFTKGGTLDPSDLYQPTNVSDPSLYRQGQSGIVLFDLFIIERSIIKYLLIALINNIIFQNDSALRINKSIFYTILLPSFPSPLSIYPSVSHSSMVLHSIMVTSIFIFLNVLKLFITATTNWKLIILFVILGLIDHILHPDGEMGRTLHNTEKHHKNEMNLWSDADTGGEADE